jgi:hypothetical protein
MDGVVALIAYKEADTDQCSQYRRTGITTRGAPTGLPPAILLLLDCLRRSFSYWIASGDPSPTGLPPAILLLLDCLRRSYYVFASYPKPPIPLSRDAAFLFVRFDERARPATKQKSRPDFRLDGFVGPTGFEPATSSMSRKRSNQLS